MTKKGMKLIFGGALWLMATLGAALANDFTVTTVGDSGLGSLRQAIIDANNASNVLNVIGFSIPGTGVKTIMLRSNMTAIVGPVILDGYSQAGASVNTLAVGDNATLLIQLTTTNNAAVGIDVLGPSTVIRGLALHGFTNAAIRVRGARATNDFIAGNFIGLNLTGTNALGNAIGILIDGTTNAPLNTAIGGTLPAHRNIIGGSTVAGIEFLNAGGGHLVQGNYIGTGTSGTNAFPNAHGIFFNATSGAGTTNTTIGGVITGAANVISGNALDGVNFAAGSGNLVQGNFIGVDATGTGALGNGIGVNVASTGNAILGNSISFNSGLGIDLGGDGVTADDPCDADDGGNHLQNFPVLASAVNTVDGIKIEGLLDSAPDTTYLLEFFSNVTCDPSGFGEGQTYLGFTNVTTGADCTNLFSVTFADFAPDGDSVTATATDPGNNTSEFSACVVVPPSPCLVTCPGDVIVPNNEGQCGAVVSFPAPIAVGVCGPVTSVPASDSFFPVGTNTVTCAAGVGAFCTFRVIVNDVDPPIIICPADFITTAPVGQDSTTVTFPDPIVTDNCPGATVICVPPSGSVLPIGTTLITCTATDGAGNTAQCTFNITLHATPPDSAELRLSMVGAPNPVITGSRVTYVLAVTNPGPAVAESVLVTDILPAGTTFFTCNATGGGICGGTGNDRNVFFGSLAPGASSRITLATTVDCDVVDGTILANTATVSSPTFDANLSNNSATVIVTASNPRPLIGCPVNIVTNVVVGQTNVVVNYPAPGFLDNCPGTTVVCVPPSGSIFPLGTNIVVCTATDNVGASRECLFDVIVLETPLIAHDLAITRITAPRTLKLSDGTPTQSPNIIVQIQNRSPHEEVISNFTGLVTLVVQSLGATCPSLLPRLVDGSPNPKLPLKLQSKKYLNIYFIVTFDCANDALQGPNHEDFKYTARVHHEVIDGIADTHTVDDICPRDPAGVDPNPNGKIKDKGCGNDTGTGVLGADVTTDIWIKQK